MATADAPWNHAHHWPNSSYWLASATDHDRHGVSRMLNVLFRPWMPSSPSLHRHSRPQRPCKAVVHIQTIAQSPTRPIWFTYTNSSNHDTIRCRTLRVSTASLVVPRPSSLISTPSASLLPSTPQPSNTTNHETPPPSSSLPSSSSEN
ncbi:hypothetical protein FA13DRAFT_1456068 [Coprinellus micaceus]|uniref:Uncharacterized protein n=1 Tax=Coprinellus micaceus TaxID=71717 RepID=A0A4Y7SPH2_COPMI|nr:hypothetical protein FA13DRAFT_1456068 [Coprinellus micaceus]